MKSQTYLIFLLAISFIIIANNVCVFRENRLHAVLDGVLVIALVTVAILYGRNKKHESWKEPNPYICGKNIAGTVYSAYPNKTPGLGWIV